MCPSSTTTYTVVAHDGSGISGELGHAAAYLLMASAHYTDLPHLLRRRKDMDLAAEMQWSLLPPLSYANAGTTLAGGDLLQQEAGGVEMVRVQ